MQKEANKLISHRIEEGQRGCGVAVDADAMEAAGGVVLRDATRDPVEGL